MNKNTNLIASTVLMIALLIMINNKLSAQASFYDMNVIQKIEIEFYQSNWDYLLDTAKAGSETYLMAKSVTINGERFDSVGVKYKGNSTYQPNQVKNPFHIELDTYKDQDYQGFKDIKLSNIAKDPSFIREVLSYSLLRQYMIAPMSNFANVFINGKLHGLYASSESIGKSFVSKHFNSKSNSFFKCNPIAGAGPGGSAKPNLVYLGNDSSKYYSAYEMKSDYGWKDLINLCDALKNNINDIEKVLDVDKALWMIAFNNLLVNLDSYIGGFAQNYYLYKDDNGRFNCMIWDLNESFGTFSQTGTLNLQNTTAKSQMTHLLHENDAAWPLVNRLLTIPRYKKMYLAHFQTIMNENFVNNSYFEKAQAIQATISNAVQSDPNKFFNVSQFQTNINNDVISGGGPGGTSAPGLKALMSGRIAYLSSLNDFKTAKPIITNINLNNSSPKINSNISITASISNANSNSVYLAYRFNKNDIFTKIPMFDDGNHNDDIAGDNIFGTDLKIENDQTQYYIYAENNSIGSFSPERAEFEFYMIDAVNETLETNIVMNEIYARGTAESPDWIELFNSSTTSIDLSGYKIYDSGGQSGTKTKKTISKGTIIPANGYYVISVDDGSESAFGLSNSGEKVWLENATGTIIDTITFAAHTAAESFGRLPNGSNWKLLDSITKGYPNSMKASSVESNLSEIINCKNYPNPFSTSTNIEFTLNTAQKIELSIYNFLGEEVEMITNEYLSEGNYGYTWNSNNFPNGIYYYILKMNNKIISNSMILMK